MTTKRRHSGLWIFLLAGIWIACTAKKPTLGSDGGDNADNPGTGSAPSDGLDGIPDGSADDIGADIGGGAAPGDGKDCGNLMVQMDKMEQCDDGNKVGGDGCTELCQIEADWDCPPTGGACVSLAKCGNGALSSAEACDDGNEVAGDGCSADCKMVEPGYECRVPGKKCLPNCGDGVLFGGEQCDDGKARADGDGCSAGCLIEPGWSCTGAPSTCVQGECGNGAVEAGESCDLGKEKNGLFYGDGKGDVPGTGCSNTCTQEPSCRDAAGKTQACAAVCGNGNVDAGETCDDGNALPNDGCSATCQTEEGFTCENKEVSDLTDCGGTQCLRLPIVFRDFDAEGSANGHPDFYALGSGSGTTTRNCVPNASGAEDPAAITASLCWASDSTDLCQGLAAPALGADGKPALGATTTCKCRFTDWDETGLAAGPGPGTKDASCDSGGAAQPARLEIPAAPIVQDAASFKQWFTNDATVNTTTVGFLELLGIGQNLYQFSSSIDDCVDGVCRSNDLDGSTVYDDIAQGPGGVLESGFFPLEDSARPKICNMWPYWVSNPDCDAQDGETPWQQWDPAANDGAGAGVTPMEGIERNFYFTTEVRYLFKFAGGGTLNFFGDDDVFVFINGVLALDMGAPHERLAGEITLPAAAGGAEWTITGVNPADGSTDERASGTSAPLGLEVGKIYEIAVFHADRHPRESNYQLTISGFSTTKSECKPTCGNGMQTSPTDTVGTPTAGEECDLGTALNTGAYGGCTVDCKFGPYCGDGTPNAEGAEECDLGSANNTATYGKEGCTPGCKLPRRCGDGKIDAAFGEECDAGAMNGKGSCLEDCKAIVE
jgi:fibro-slime domain-containing protein